MPEEVVALVAELGLQPRRQCVPAHAPATRPEWEDWREIWPLHWRPPHKSQSEHPVRCFAVVLLCMYLGGV